MDIDPEHLGSLAADAFERRIAHLEREKVELQRRLQGKKKMQTIYTMALDIRV